MQQLEHMQLYEDRVGEKIVFYNPPDVSQPLYINVKSLESVYYSDREDFTALPDENQVIARNTVASKYLQDVENAFKQKMNDITYSVKCLLSKPRVYEDEKDARFKIGKTYETKRGRRLICIGGFQFIIEKTNVVDYPNMSELTELGDEKKMDVVEKYFEQIQDTKKKECYGHFNEDVDRVPKALDQLKHFVDGLM